MDWEGGKQHSYALVTLCFRDGDREHYDEVIFSKPIFVNNDHIQLLNMMYSGVSSDPVDYRSQGGSPYEEYWQDGMNAVSIYNVKYLTTNEYEVLSKFNVATFLGAESQEKKDWKGVSLAGSVEEIKDMLRAEGDPEWMSNKDLRRQLFLKSQKDGVPKICEVCEDAESNLHYYQEDGEQFVVCKNCLEQSMDDWKTIFGHRPKWNAEVDNNDRFWVDLTCPWCGEPYDGTEVFDEYEGQIVHYRCAASDNYEAETQDFAAQEWESWIHLATQCSCGRTVEPYEYKIRKYNENNKVVDVKYKCDCGGGICRASHYGNIYSRAIPCRNKAEYMGLCSYHATCQRCNKSLKEDYEYWGRDEGHDDGYCNQCYDDTGKYGAETFEGNFSESMDNYITYEVSFTSSLPMDEDYDYDDRIIQDYVEELIRDDGSRNGIQSFEFVMDSGWYSDSTIDGTVTWWTGNYSAETFEASQSMTQYDDPEYTGEIYWNEDLDCHGYWEEGQFYCVDDFEAPSYGSYYGACLLPDGSCTETSLDMCRALGGRFQGPGTSCYPDAGWARPRVMQAESTSSGLGKGFTIGIVAGIISGLVTTVFGTVISEILLDRLREDPELEITEEDLGTNAPPL